MCNHSYSTEQFWKQVDEAHARALLICTTGAARAFVEYSQAWSTSKRATALLGTNTGREYEVRAEMYYRTYIQQLRWIKQAFARFAEEIDEDSKTRIAEFLKGDGFKDLTASVRHKNVLTLVHSAVSVDEAQRIVNSLDANLRRVEGLSSWQEIDQYLNQDLDELLAKKMDEYNMFDPPNALQLCIFTLKTGNPKLYTRLVIAALLLCISTLGGLPFDQVLTALEESACGI